MRIDGLRTDAAALKKHANDLDKLSSMPDRVTRRDIQGAAQTILDAANDIQTLLRGRLPGCPCRVIEDESYSRVIYDEACPHHGHLEAQLKAYRKRIEDVERALKDDARQRFALAAIPALASHEASPRAIVERALQIADAMVTELAR